ncbi:MAG: tRNA pseudouridine(38-40) synthase TruA, partial [Porphyromonas sp.]
MRYFITLSYDGTNYSGWQTQPDATTVQETIEQALTLVARSPEPIAI